ncbi:MAG: hypothetical protein JJT94_14820 [Bernardetiaceae bacterium]|nr:hypothetical protein [Bernardetiaceae bacterium]
MNLQQKCFTLGFILLTSLMLWGCAQERKEVAQEETSESAETQSEAKKTNFPNKKSELSLLMRSMWDSLDNMREDIQNERKISDLRAMFKGIHTATPTDEHTKTEVYEPLAVAFNQNLEKLYEAEGKDMQLKAYNLLVESCMTCHEQQCPGPMSKIRKLYVKNED